MSVGAALPNPETLPPAALRASVAMVSWLCRLLGPLRYLTADAAGMAVYLAHPQVARRTAHNHARAAGGLGAAEAARRARGSFREYARMLVDTAWAGSLSADAVRRSTVITGWEHLERQRTAGRGAIVAMCHHGSWDMAVAAGVARRLRFTTVMAPFGPPWLTEVAAWERRRRGLELLSLERAALGFVHALRHGGFVGVMVDIPEAGPAVEVSFCRGPVRFSPVAAWLALRTGAPIIPVECRRSAGIHRVAVHPPLFAAAGEGEAALTQRLALILETVIARHPTQWYPFHAVYTDEH